MHLIHPVMSIDHHDITFTVQVFNLVERHLLVSAGTPLINHAIILWFIA
jgi:hypothetical protein